MRARARATSRARKIDLPLALSQQAGSQHQGGQGPQSADLGERPPPARCRAGQAHLAAAVDLADVEAWQRERQQHPRIVDAVAALGVVRLAQGDVPDVENRHGRGHEDGESELVPPRLQGRPRRPVQVQRDAQPVLLQEVQPIWVLEGHVLVHGREVVHPVHQVHETDGQRDQNLRDLLVCSDHEVWQGLHRFEAQGDHG
mmetsp:Transcript_76787/g.194909  ORF Transcript_76787/g.194909 Transcript_76787/m.194909 type:complete len:200 (+) Transcript_76787:35-634(+)